MFEGLFQPVHLLVIFGIALLVFGPKELPELGKAGGYPRLQVSQERGSEPANSKSTIAGDQNWPR